MQTKQPHEVFALLKSTKSKKARIKVLQDNASYELKSIIQANFTPSIVFDLPEGAPPYKPSNIPAGLQMTHVSKLIRMLPMFLVGSRGLTPLQKEKKFCDVLESCHAEDALIIISMKDKKLTKDYPFATEDIFREAYPTIF